MTYPSIEPGLAADVFTAMGVERDASVEHIVAAARSWLPAGSTAKITAMAAGEVPPGPHPTTALEARLAGSLQSWSCWPLCTSIGAVLADAGHDVDVLVEHRRGIRNALVDFHSVLVVDGCLVDPYLGPSAPVAPGEDVTRFDAWASWVPGDGRSDHLGLRAGGSTYRYRSLATGLDAADVEAFCAISVTHTGVGARRYAHWLDAAGFVVVTEDEVGVATKRVARGSSPFSQSRVAVATGRYEDLVTSSLDHGADVASRGRV